MAEALKRNPGLKSLEAEIRRAEASLSMAHKAGLPDFGVGAEVNAVSIPVMLRPMASMTLPIWREKTSSGIAAARAAKRSAEAKLDAAQIKLAVDCARASTSPRSRRVTWKSSTAP
jgi:outer membrane protein TolC